MNGIRKRLTFSASTAHPNTPSTDTMPEVLHRVWCSNMDGTGECEVLLMAADPLEALEKVSTMDADEFRRLERTPETAA